MTSPILSKDNYDQFLQFSRITPENWLLPDRKNYVPFGITQEAWVQLFLAAKLKPTVPKDVIKVFEIARGAMIYSWFFYPLATLGLEQCTRVGEFAIRERCRLLPGAPGNFAANIAKLVTAGVITPEDETRWQAMRDLRNDRSHLNGFMLTDPGEASWCMNSIAELINSLF